VEPRLRNRRRNLGRPRQPGSDIRSGRADGARPAERRGCSGPNSRGSAGMCASPEPRDRL
jgi:hypothetical protein